jgi:hypothetical protein
MPFHEQQPLPPSPAAAAAAAKKSPNNNPPRRKNKDCLLPQHLLKYGLEIVNQNPLTYEVTAVRCAFCVHFGRELNPEEEQDNNMDTTHHHHHPRKRQRAFSRIKYWNGPSFRTDMYTDHLRGSHSSKWQVYQNISDRDKMEFFEQSHGGGEGMAAAAAAAFSGSATKLGRHVRPPPPTTTLKSLWHPSIPAPSNKRRANKEAAAATQQEQQQQPPVPNTVVDPLWQTQKDDILDVLTFDTDVCESGRPIFLVLSLKDDSCPEYKAIQETIQRGYKRNHSHKEIVERLILLMGKHCEQVVFESTNGK